MLFFTYRRGRAARNARRGWVRESFRRVRVLQQVSEVKVGNPNPRRIQDLQRNKEHVQKLEDIEARNAICFLGNHVIVLWTPLSSREIHFVHRSIQRPSQNSARRGFFGGRPHPSRLLIGAGRQNPRIPELGRQSLRRELEDCIAVARPSLQIRIWSEYKY